ncbi:MAG: hypothetical protein QS98_C0008G0015 [archaeon GW2011_AR3]|nr:MAG: hypothetical protein QS98_C0008G0015 [archaeon GW2011_AR3]
MRVMKDIEHLADNESGRLPPVEHMEKIPVIPVQEAVDQEQISKELTDPEDVKVNAFLKRINVYWQSIDQHISYYFGEGKVREDGSDIDIKKEGVRAYIFNRKVTKTHHKRWLPINHLLNLYEENKEKPIEFLEASKDYNSRDESLRSFYPKLAEKISILSKMQKEELYVLWDLLLMAKADKRVSDKSPILHPEKIPEVMQELGVLNDKRLMETLHRLLEIASGMECDYLRNEIAILQSSVKNQQHVKLNLREYIESIRRDFMAKGISDRLLVSRLEKIEGKISGGMEAEVDELNIFRRQMAAWNLASQNFQQQVQSLRDFAAGVKTKYNDRALYEKLLGNSKIRKLLFFFQEYRFISDNIMAKINSAYGIHTDGGANMEQVLEWKDFISMVENFDKIKQKLKTDFGDDSLSERLAKLAKDQKENLNLWKETVTNILENEFRNPAVQNELLNRCTDSVNSEIQARIVQIEAETSKLDLELAKLLLDRINQLDRKRIPAIKGIIKLAEKEINALLENINSFAEAAMRENLILANEWVKIEEKILKMEDEFKKELVDLRNGYEKISPKEVDEMVKIAKEMAPSAYKETVHAYRILQDFNREIQGYNNHSQITTESLQRHLIQLTAGLTRSSVGLGTLDEIQASLLAASEEQKKGARKNYPMFLSKADSTLRKLRIIIQEFLKIYNNFFIGSKSETDTKNAGQN